MEIRRAHMNKLNSGEKKKNNEEKKHIHKKKPKEREKKQTHNAQCTLHRL